MSKRTEPKPPVDPRTRAGIYGLGALYLAYLFYQIAKPYLTHAPDGPTTFQLFLGLVILGGGAAALALLAWRMYRAPELEESEEDVPPEDGGD